MAMYATDKDKREYEQAMGEALDDALIEALGSNSLNSKDLRGESWAGQYKAMLKELKKQGACAKVPKPPRRAGLIKS